MPTKGEFETLPRCKRCGGVGKVQSLYDGPHDCEDCNGTGIEGNPAKGCLLIIGLWLVIGLIGYLLFG